MMNKNKYQMKSNQNKKKAEMNCRMTTMKNMILYLIVIILKYPKKRNSKEDMEEKGINLKSWIQREMGHFMHKTVHRRKMCSFMTTNRG